MEIKYSIITPTYNSYKYMDKYFRSMEEQTNNNFEIIIVDDCSTDGTYNKIQAFSEKSSLRIKLLKTNKNSGGPAEGRNLGIDKADGEWITFVDADDWVSKNFLCVVDRAIQSNNVNCVMFDAWIFMGKTKLPYRMMYSNLREDRFVTVGEFIQCGIDAPWGKFFKAEALRRKKVRFPLLKRCDDVAFSPMAVEACGSIYYIRQPLYCYLQRFDSLSNDENSSNVSYMVEAFRILHKNLGEKYRENLTDKSVWDLLYGGVLMMCKAGEKKEKILRFISDYETSFPNWESNSSIKSLNAFKRIFIFLIAHKCVGGLRLMAIAHSGIVRIVS